MAMRAQSSFVTWIAALAAFALAPTGALAGYPPDRNGFMIGFGVGGGSVGIEDGDEREGGVTGNFRIGYAVAPTLVIHLESSAWTKTSEGELVGIDEDTFLSIYGDVTWTFSTAVAALTYYPSSGLFFRGGLGVGVAEVEVEVADIDISEDESGFAALAAVGYEWRLTKKFALAPQADFIYQDLDVLGSANVFGGSLGFNWYW
jgi:hypothetical protein